MKPSTYYFYMKRNILAHFQTPISVPLNDRFLIVLQRRMVGLKHENLVMGFTKKAQTEKQIIQQ